jgi:hypothetical protein
MTMSKTRSLVEQTSARRPTFPFVFRLGLFDDIERRARSSMSSDRRTALLSVVFSSTSRHRAQVLMSSTCRCPSDISAFRSSAMSLDRVNEAHRLTLFVNTSFYNTNDPFARVDQIHVDRENKIVNVSCQDSLRSARASSIRLRPSATSSPRCLLSNERTESMPSIDARVHVQFHRC